MSVYAAIGDEETETNNTMQNEIRFIPNVLSAPLRELTTRYKFGTGVLVGMLFMVMVITMSANTVKVVHRKKITIRREMKEMIRGMSTGRISGSAYTPYECGVTETVFCCKEKDKQRANQLQKSIKWYTTECDAFEDGWTCCYYTD